MGLGSGEIPMEKFVRIGHPKIKILKIIVFYQYFGTPKGGWSTRVYEMCRRWVAQGAEVTVVTSPYDKSDISAQRFFDTQNFEGIKVKIINLPQSNKHPIWKRIYTFLGFSFFSLWYALVENYDIAIASSGPITIGLPGLVAKWIRRKKLIFEVRDLWPLGAIELGMIRKKGLQKIALFAEKTFYQASDFIVTCSDGMTENIQKRFPKLDVRTIPNASDVELFQKKTSFVLPEKYHGKKIIVYTGSLGAMDNCEQMIRGIAAFAPQPDVCFVIIGEGAEKHQLMELARTLEIQNIEFLGLIPKVEVIGWLQNAYAALVTFRNLEVFQTSSPNKLFDAFAAGVPLIQNTQGWIKTLFLEVPCGINVPQENPAEFGKAIERMVASEEERNEMAAHSKMLGETRFNRDQLAEEYFQWMKKLRP
jgi:glycosyltransferase involved in cell wall biosynthesis